MVNYLTANRGPLRAHTARNRGRITWASFEYGANVFARLQAPELVYQTVDHLFALIAKEIEYDAEVEHLVLHTKYDFQGGRGIDPFEDAACTDTIVNNVYGVPAYLQLMILYLQKASGLSLAGVLKKVQRNIAINVWATHCGGELMRLTRGLHDWSGECGGEEFAMATKLFNYYGYAPEVREGKLYHFFLADITPHWDWILEQIPHDEDLESDDEREPFEGTERIGFYLVKILAYIHEYKTEPSQKKVVFTTDLIFDSLGWSELVQTSGHAQKIMEAKAWATFEFRIVSQQKLPQYYPNRKRQIFDWDRNEREEMEEVMHPKPYTPSPRYQTRRDIPYPTQDMINAASGTVEQIDERRQNRRKEEAEKKSAAAAPWSWASVLSLGR